MNKTMKSILRRGLVIAFGSSLGVAASCHRYGADAFNEDVAYLACEIQRECEDEISGGILDQLPNGFGCEDELMERFASCEARCEYRDDAARRCVERLDDVLSDCEPRDMGPCRRAYHDCPDSCDLWNCAVVPGGGRQGAAWMLALLGWLAARRRRPSVRA